VELIEVCQLRSVVLSLGLLWVLGVLCAFLFGMGGVIGAGFGCCVFLGLAE